MDSTVDTRAGEAARVARVGWNGMRTDTDWVHCIDSRLGLRWIDGGWVPNHNLSNMRIAAASAVEESARPTRAPPLHDGGASPAARLGCVRIPLPAIDAVVLVQDGM